MLLGISALFIRPGRVGGAETMVRNLLQGLSSIERPGDGVILFANQSIERPASDNIMTATLPNGMAWNRFLQETFVLPRVARECDAFIFPNYFTPPVVAGQRCATVIHDLLYLHFPQNFSRRKRLWLHASHQLTLHRADVVIAISEFTRRELLRYYGHRFEDKIHVIHNPVSWERYDVTGTRGDEAFVDAPYILSVAAHWPHKNLETLIRAFAMVRKHLPDLRLVLVGQLSGNLVGVSRRSHLEELISDLCLTDVVTMTGYIPDDAVGTWYRHASLFAFPSLFEGFGMPPIEALGMGLPVLTTRCGAIAEVTQGMAEMVDDPTDPEEMCSRMRAMLRNPSLYAPTPEDQVRIREMYSPATIATRYYDLLRGVSGHAP